NIEHHLALRFSRRAAALPAEDAAIGEREQGGRHGATGTASAEVSDSSDGVSPAAGRATHEWISWYPFIGTLNTTSPCASPVAPQLSPRKTRPSASASRAVVMAPPARHRRWSAIARKASPTPRAVPR